MEGSVRGGNREFARYLQVAIGSAGELEYDLLLSADLRTLGSQRVLRTEN